MDENEEESWIAVGPLHDLPDGRGVALTIADRRVALFRLGDEVLTEGPEKTAAVKAKTPKKWKPVTCWAAYRDGHLLYESMRGTRGEVRRYITVLFGINRLYTMQLLGIEICKVNIVKVR